jgi:non-ribosomal peptide synthetase component F
LVTDFIRYQVKRAPDAFAVHVENEAPYTYEALWQLVQQITTKAPFVPGAIVPVCMDLTVEFVASLLAIMVCGAAYVVLDPSGSAERNRVIVEDCNAGVVLVHERYQSNFVRALPIENILSNDVTEASHTLLIHGPIGSPSDLAYLVYTSGEELL